jgi:short-subunit dehydrogenase
MSRILIFGSSSGLGSCLVDQFSITGHNLIPISSSEVDFNSETSIDQIQKIIEINQPDVIINCAGVLGNNQDDFNKIFNINLRSNWIISKYFINNIPTSKQVKIIFIGSSAYKKGKKDYILYASSKAALFNLFEGVSALFENTEVIFGLVNPTRMDTKMIKELTKTPGLEYLDPRDVAHTIINFITTLEKSTYLNL